MHVRSSAGWRIALACALAVVACTALAPRVTAAPDARARLARLTRSVAEHAARWPFEAPSLPGALKRGPDIVPVTAAVIDSDRAFRSQVERELAALEPSLRTLDVNARADAAVLRDWLALAHASRDAERTFESDAGAPWPRIDAALRALLVGRGTPLCHRLGIATRRLRAIPEALRAEQTVLDPTRTSPRSVAITLDAFERTRGLLRIGLPAGVRECRDPGSVAAFAEADSDAARAVEAYADWLRNDVGPRAKGGEVSAWASPDADSIRATIADSLLGVRARKWPNGSIRATLGRRDAAMAWADLVLEMRGTRDDFPPGLLALPLTGVRRDAERKRGAPVAPRALLEALMAEGPVHPGAVHDAVLRRLGVR